ncbi:MAG: hypothetical protein LBP80_01490 [Treponema sp.]|jgi:hypothetical protein|nr:hypothetical protein [Treponema sp.]
MIGSRKPAPHQVPRLLCFSLFCALGILGAFPAFAAENIELTIRFFDKRVYYLAEAPILVQVTVANNGPGSYSFRLADDRAFSVDFDVRTVSNRPLEAAPPLIRKRSGYQQVFFREVAVESGESFSFVEDIRDYVNFRNSGAYVVTARLFPGLYRGPLAAQEAVNAGGKANGGANGTLESNRLSLNLRPASIPGPDGIPLEMDVETNAVLVREELPPDEVVDYTLRARQKSQWEKFFLYLDLESLLSRNSARARQWRAESEEGRRRMIARYREELQSAVIDGDIATIPTEYTIERTSYGAEEGAVIVLEKFKVPSGDYTERKRYTYTLHRRDNIWTIVDYVVLNLGTE